MEPGPAPVVQKAVAPDPQGLLVQEVLALVDLVLEAVLEVPVVQWQLLVLWKMIFQEQNYLGIGLLLVLALFQ